MVKLVIPSDSFLGSFTYLYALGYLALEELRRGIHEPQHHLHLARGEYRREG